MRLSAALVVLATVIVAHASSAQTVQAVDAVNVVDANGKKVGRATVTVSAGVSVVLEEGNVFIPLAIGNTAASPSPPSYGFLYTGNVDFESVDCSGPPFVARHPPGQISGAVFALAAPGHTLYVADYSQAPITVTIAAGKGYSGPSEPGCVPYSSPEQVLDQPAVALVDLDTLFTPPFHLEAAPSASPAACCGDCNGDGSVTINEIITSVGYALTSCPK